MVRFSCKCTLIVLAAIGITISAVGGISSDLPGTRSLKRLRSGHSYGSYDLAQEPDAAATRKTTRSGRSYGNAEPDSKKTKAEPPKTRK